MYDDLKDKVAIVTGGAGGIGEELACRLALEGVKVFVSDIDPAACERVCEKIGGQARPVALNIAQSGAIDATVNDVFQQAGQIDLLVNCAGVYGMQGLVDITEEEFDRIVSINLRGLLFMTQAVARKMITANKGGAIVNVASAAARRASVGSTVYAASKAGVISVTQAAAQELAPHKIRVNAIAPGAVETPMWEAVKLAYAQEGAMNSQSVESSQLGATPAGRLCTAQDCTQAILYLCSKQSDFITGQTLNVDGGLYMN